MKILYLAKHDSGDNDDEGAIAYALEQLGHEVRKVHELRKHRKGVDLGQTNANFCLFHKCATVSELRVIARNMPIVFWYFDMIRPIDGDPTLLARSESRVAWMKEVLPICTLGFCTDGDWVADDKTGKLRWLMQGMDERVAGFGTPLQLNDPTPAIQPLLFTGMINHGQRRAQHVAELQERYGDKFAVLGDGGPRYRRHGRQLADVFASTKIVIAPDGPNTDRYWSNRVYLTLGLGGFLLHPYCEGLAKQYDTNELMFYDSREYLHHLIDAFLSNDKHREQVRRAGYEATIAKHLYVNRVNELLMEVKKHL